MPISIPCLLWSKNFHQIPTDGVYPLHDEEINLYQNYHRDYNPNLGRYLQTDPIGLAGGMNRYGYAGQSRLRYIDEEELQLSDCSTAMMNAGLGHFCKPPKSPRPPRPFPNAGQDGKCRYRPCVGPDYQEITGHLMTVIIVWINVWLNLL